VEVYAHVRYDERVTPERKKKIIRGMKFRMYLRFPALLFKRVKWTIKDVAPTPFEYGVLMVKAVGI
jgi:hypothetical protein